MINGEIDNLILATDSYKLNHWNQYPKDTQGVYSYFESRPGAKYPDTVFFGLQYLLKRYLEGQAVTYKMLEEASPLATNHFGGTGFFNYKGWANLISKHNGYLPLKIKAVPEGTVVPTGNVLMTVENTDPEFFWLTNALESLLVHVWHPSTVATLSKHTFEMIASYLRETADTMDALAFMLHDFGYRGAAGHEAAALGGAGHLVNGLGTDTLPAMLLALKYYKADPENLAFSVPATEHSVMTALGKRGEPEVVDRLLDEYPTGILSVVSDSYDIEAFVNRMGIEPKFYDRIMARDGKFVFRPDSVRSPSDTPEQQMVDLSQVLWQHFGGTTNQKGYRVLDPHVGLLWGDGINPEGIAKILANCKQAGYSAENYVFGMGGGLLQKINRDTQRFAFKCGAQMRDDEWHDCWKDPLDKTKTSKRGRLKLVQTLDGGLMARPKGIAAPMTTVREEEPGEDLLEVVFENGKVVKEWTFDEIRERAKM